MKLFAALIIFAWLAFPGFSQNANSQNANSQNSGSDNTTAPPTHQQRWKALGDTISKTASNSKDKLADYDDQVADDGNTKNYTDYKRKYDTLSKALSESESRLDLLIRTNDRRSRIKAERDNYERLGKKMDDLNSEYDSWLQKTK